jgi:hypothetical protein
MPASWSPAWTPTSGSRTQSTRLDLTETEVSGIPGLVEELTEAGARARTRGVIEGATEKLTELLIGDEDEHRRRGR